MKRILSLWLMTFLVTAALWASFTPEAFTVSADGKQVYFSQGNLQCSGLTKNDTTWSFAEHQYDILGAANVSGGNLADTIDMFGWSANNETAKWGISSSIDNSDYPSTDFVDWGANTIGNYASNTYRTLTYDEWKYLLNTRTNASEKKGIARINLNRDGTQYTNGIILLPDNWTCPVGMEFKSGFASYNNIQAYADHQTFTLAQWQQLEEAGAVFLPASGVRIGANMSNVQLLGNYWSATNCVSFSGYAYRLYFLSDGANASNYTNRFIGGAVRLVQDRRFAIAIIASEYGSITTDKSECAVGKPVTLTITENAYCNLRSFTVLQGETKVQTTAVEGKVNTYTFTMPAGDVTITAEFEKLASAFTPVLFTIAEGKQVYFSPGNLQCAGLTTNDTTWSFAEYQTDMLGTGNVSNTALSDTIDLFGWSGNTGTAQWGISTSTDSSDYSGMFADWGANTIDNYAPNTYRTLTNDEWNYLLNKRPNASDKKGVARIKLTDTEYANGLILLPDNWKCPEDIEFKSGFASDYSLQAYADHQTFTLAQWRQLETAGAVFLPASGRRIGASMDNVQDYGNYWSATTNASGRPYYLYLDSKEASTYIYRRYYGHAVRLVQDRRFAIAITTPEFGSITTDKTECAAGETVTLTMTGSAYYRLRSFAVLQRKAEVQTTAVEGKVNTYTFTMPASTVTITAEFEKVASAFAPAAFSVAEGKQVYFSPGNLQCAGLTTNDTTWSFAEYQTDMLGTANVSADHLADTIDMFGWSANNETAKWGVSTSTDYTDYLGEFVDWGQNIGDGTTYRTLTYDEWEYLLNTRTNASEKTGVARINLSSDGTQYTNGIILLPDNWTCPVGIEFQSTFASEGSIEAYATNQTFSLSEWQQLEAQGAVFLPASGFRFGVNMGSVQNYGSFWSATANGRGLAYDLYFDSKTAYATTGNRTFGLAVRLVQDLRFAITITTPQHGSITTDKTECAAGEVVTLTLAPEIGYRLQTLTVWQGETEIPTTLIEGTTDQYTFVMPAGNVMVSAIYEIQTFTISTSAVNGTVTGGGTYDYGTTVKLEAKPDNGYVFSHWSDDTKDNPYEFVVTTNLTLEAVFVPGVPSEVDATQSAAGDSVRKVLIDGKVYILRNGKTYTLTGVEVK